MNFHDFGFQLLVFRCQFFFMPDEDAVQNKKQKKHWIWSQKSIFFPKNISSGLISVVMTCVQILIFLGPEQGSADHGLFLCCNLHLPESEVRTQVRSLSFRKSTIAYFGKNGYPNGTKQIIKVVVIKRC